MKVQCLLCLHIHASKLVYIYIYINYVIEYHNTKRNGKLAKQNYRNMKKQDMYALVMKFGCVWAIKREIA